MLSFSVIAAEQNKTDIAAEARLDRFSVYGQRQRDTFGCKSAILLKELPQSIQLLDVDKMRAQGLVSVGDLLWDTPSANPGHSRVGPYQSLVRKFEVLLPTKCAATSASVILKMWTPQRFIA